MSQSDALKNMTHYMALIPGKHVARAKHATASVPAEEAKKGRNGVMTERTEGGGHVPRTSVIFFFAPRLPVLDAPV